MGENVNTAEQKNAPMKGLKYWFKGLSAEFKKIIWPKKVEVGKQTVIVIVISIVLGLIIAIADMIFQYGIDLLIK